MSYGYKFSKDYRDTANGTNFQTVGDLYYDEMKQEISFIIIAAGLTLIFSVILLAGLCTDCISPKAKHILATLTLILEFAIAVVLALRASNNSNMRDAYPGLEDKYDNFKLFYRLCLSDTIITFVLQVVYMFVIFYGTLKEVIHTEIITPVVAEVPPLSNRQF